ncbi:hypothetical protein NMY22_g9581 [Coprinellus aureogranulatus]|nr:hypothetical protein NMY22_g9581 [Coprinellus aureogranulatus]
MAPKPSLDALLAKAARAKAGHNNVHSASSARQASGSIIRSGGSGPTTKINLPSPQPLLMLPASQSEHLPAPSTANSPSVLKPPRPSASTKSRTKPSQPQVFTDFEQRKDRIVELFFQHYTSEGLGEECGCGRAGAIRTTICRECWQYPATCSTCWVHAHVRCPTHWAEVWSAERDYFVRHDISALEGNPAIHLVHSGEICPFSKKSAPRQFIVVDLNGVHNTMIVFCGCLGAPSEYEQLLAARLFPATFRDPQMAFTFQLLHNFHVHHLESAESAYDFIGALRHLTDGLFFDQASDPYDQFRDVFKLYRLLVTEIRAGIFHGVNQAFPHRHADDVGVRHLLQVLLTADGNFHANHYAKNHEASHESLLRGRACFPDDSRYREFIQSVDMKASKSNADKTTCAFLKDVNRQDKSKFAGMDVSGIINIQCHHVMVLATVDLYKGEKGVEFYHTDYAIYHTLRRLGITKLTPDILELVDFLFSYNISCAFATNLLQCCIDHGLSEMLPVIRQLRPLIPMLHIQNHKDNCMYNFASAYTDCAGHFHGETAEQPWTYDNLFAGQGRQMGPGARHDLYDDLHNWWNQKKKIDLPSQLHNDLLRADKLRQEKQDTFLGLCELFRDMLSEWRDEPRDKREKVGKEVYCVYRHSPSELPSKKQIYTALIKDLQSDATLEQTKAKTLPLMLNHSLTIRRLQQKIKSNKAALAKYGDSRFETAIKTLRGQLGRSMKRFRELQEANMPEIDSYIASVADLSMELELEDEILYTPSDIPEDARIQMNYLRLAELERKLLEGAAYDTLAKIRTSVRLLGVVSSDGKRHVWGQAGNTRQQVQIINATLERDLNIDYYNTVRNELISLGLPENDKTLRKMTIAATSRKSTDAKRALGDTGRTDGTAWTARGINADKQRQRFRPVINPQSSTPDAMVGVQSQQASVSSTLSHPFLGVRNRSGSVVPAHGGKKTKLVPQSDADSGQQAPESSTSKSQSECNTAASSSTPSGEDSAGWIWNVTSPNKKLSDAEVERYLREGDRVQWFRAEAEMLRWQEEWERKLVEFVRCIRSFDKTSEAWLHAAGRQDISSGMASYAKKTANRHRELSRRARDVFRNQAKHDASELGNEGVPSILTYIVTKREEFDRVIDQAMGRRPPMGSHSSENNAGQSGHLTGCPA